MRALSSQRTGLVGLATLFLAACGGGGGGGPPAPVIQGTVAPAAASFAMGAPVVLDVELENVSGSPASVSILPGCVLEIVSLARNAIPVMGTTTDLRAEQEIPQAVDARLVTLAPGEAQAFTWQSGHEGTAQILSHRFLDAQGRSKRTAFRLDLAGTYSIMLRYRFQGENPNGLPQAVASSETFGTDFVVLP